MFLGVPDWVIQTEWRIVAPNGLILQHWGGTAAMAWSSICSSSKWPEERLRAWGYRCRKFRLVAMGDDR